MNESWSLHMCFKMACAGACKCDCTPFLSRPVEKFANNAWQETDFCNP